MKEGEGSTENKETRKKDGGTKEGEGSSENKENSKKDDERNEGEGSSENMKKDDDSMKEGEGSLENQDNTKKDDATKERVGSSENKENTKKDDGTKEGEGSSKNKENLKKDDGMKQGEGLSENKENTTKDDGMKEGDGSSQKKRIRKKGVEPKEDSHIDNESQLEMCDRSLQKCQKQDLVACLPNSETGLSTELVMVVQNVGDNTLDVNIAVPSSVRFDAKSLNLAKHSTKKVNISAGDTKTLKIVLTDGKGDCVIEVGINPSVTDWLQFPIYAKQLSPIYGVYFVLFILLIAAAVWGCCRLRRDKRDGGGVPYQQLGMGIRRQSNSEIVQESTVDGWEQDWDNEWDEEEVPARPSGYKPKWKYFVQWPFLNICQ